MEYVYLIMGTYKNDPEFETIFAAYASCEAAYEARERLLWDSAVAYAYVWKERIRK